MSDEYQRAKKRGAELEAACEAASEKLRSLVPNDGRPTPDAIRCTPEYILANNEFKSAFAALRTFNGWFMKRYKKEEREARRVKIKVGV